MLIDKMMPLYHFNEVQSAIVRSNKRGNLLNAVRDVTPKEIPFLIQLFWLLRGLPSSIILRKRYKFSINKNRPLLEQFLASGFILLAEEESRELVIGGIGQFWKLWGGSFPIIGDTEEFLSFNIPNYAKAAINFYVYQDQGDDCVKISTETRFYVPDQITLKKFARYWFLIIHLVHLVEECG